MKKEYLTVKGNTRITEEYELHGTITGNTTVSGGGIFKCYGTCKGDVIIEMGGETFLYGTVEGNVQNRGGYLEISGEIKGSLSKAAGHTVVHDGAKLSGK